MTEALTDHTLDDMRRDARRIFLAAVHAAEPAPLVHAALLNAPELHTAARIDVLAAGKASAGMTAAALETLGSRVARCVAVGIGAVENMDGVRHFVAGHPLPDAGSVQAARAAMALVTSAEPDTALVVLLSGGASALLALPSDGISIDDYRTTTHLLLHAGASIDELNCVRKHIDDIKGGRLARAAVARNILCLVVSDVVGNRLDVIASGPLAPDPTTFGDALDILERFALRTTVPTAVMEHLQRGARGAVEETLKPDASIFDQVRHQVLADNATAADAAASYARRLGYDAARLADPVTGESRSAGAQLGALLRASHGAVGSCLVAGGETTVSVSGNGRGGRNQEVAVAAAIELEGTTDCVLLSGGTDGIDGSTAAAGGIVDGGTAARMRASHIDPADALRRNDSYTALASSGDLLVTGPTGTNVMDVHVLLRGPAYRA